MDFQKTIEQVKEGLESPLKVLAELKMLKTELELAISEVEPLAFKEVENYPQKNFKEFGYNFEFRSGAKTYDFSKIKEWSDLKDSMKKKEALYKMAASAYEKGTQVFDDETGEQIPIPLVKYSKPSLIIKKNDHP